MSYLPSDALFRPTITTRVQNGVHWLNERVPAWREIIRIEKLDISSGCNCMLAQIFGTDFSTVQPIFMSKNEAAERGFLSYGDCDAFSDEYELLQAAWTQELTTVNSVETKVKAAELCAAY